MTIADTIMVFLRGINDIPGSFLFVIIVAFMLGYIVGRAFTAETYWGRIWRAVFGGMLTLAFAPSGDAVNLLLVIYLLGFLFGVRVYVHAFLYWIWDFIVWCFGRLTEMANGFLKIFFYVAQGIHDIIIGFSRMRMFSWEWKAKVREAEEWAARSAAEPSRGSSSGQTRPDVDAARRAREEAVRERQREEAAAESSRSSGRTREAPREEPRQERRETPPPRTMSKEEERRAAAMLLGIDPMLFTFEDLRQAYRKKVRQLHPDQYEQLPEDMLKDLDNRLKAVNVAHDLLKQWKGWK
jgi:hypothetical protein